MDSTVQARPSFDVVRRGYERAQVDERLGQLHAELAEAKRAQRVSEQRNAELAEQLRNARAELAWPSRESMPSFTDRVGKILGLAEEEAAELRSKAQAELAEARSRGQTELDAVRESARHQHHAAEQERQQLQALRQDLRERLLSVRGLLEALPQPDAENGSGGADGEPTVRMER